MKLASCTRVALGCLLALGSLAGTAAGQATDGFTATTVNMDPAGEDLKIDLLRWSSDEDRQAVVRRFRLWLGMFMAGNLPNFAPAEAASPRRQSKSPQMTSSSSSSPPSPPPRMRQVACLLNVIGLETNG